MTPLAYVICVDCGSVLEEGDLVGAIWCAYGVHPESMPTMLRKRPLS